MSRLISSLFFIAVLTACSTNDDNKVLQEVAFEDGVLTEIHVENISPEIQQIKLSELLEDFKFIPLETNEKCLISNTKIYFSEDFILVGTQNFPGPARLYRFDKNGNFINEIGKAGRGPGENEGYLIEVIYYCEKNNTIMAKWDGKYDNPKIYDNNGTFLFEIQKPENQPWIDIYSWDDSIWFSTGSIAGQNMQSLRDSVALIFYNREGNILKKIPRKLYPPDKGYSPPGRNSSVYRYDNQWGLYMQGNDTVFNLSGMNLIPYAVLVSGTGTYPYNKSVTPEQLIGKYYLNILAETSNNWFIKKETTTEANVREYAPSQWSSQFKDENQLIIVDKNSKEAIIVKLIDDIFNFIPEEYFSMGLLEWKDKRVFFALPPYMLKELIEGIDLNNIATATAKEVIEKIKYIPVDDNPIIFSFSLKERFEIPSR